MIQLSDVSKRFRIAPGPGRRGSLVTAIADVSAALEAGRIVGVVGPNGAGKTTLFGLLLGFLEPSAGTITVAGLDPRAYVRRHGANYLPERFQLPRGWTVRSGLHALAALEKSGRPVDELLAEFELTAAGDQAVHTLSHGTLQRVGLAQAVATPRRLMLLDEPTDGLDPLWRVRFRALIRELRAPDRLILVASHDLVEIERVADRVLILNSGTIADTIELRSPSDAVDYTIVLAAPHAAVLSVFPDARASGDARYDVTVANSADLSAKIAALLESGATLVSVNPARSLEQRVTRSARPES